MPSDSGENIPFGRAARIFAAVKRNMSLERVMSSRSSSFAASHTPSIFFAEARVSVFSRRPKFE